MPQQPIEQCECGLPKVTHKHGKGGLNDYIFEGKITGTIINQSTLSPKSAYAERVVKEFEDHFERCLGEYWDNLTFLERERYVVLYLSSAGSFQSYRNDHLRGLFT